MWMWWIALLLLFLAGLGVGFLWGRSTTDASRKAEKLDQELRQTRAALETYKDEVNAHFATTAQLVEKLTEDYKAVYRHLAEGSEKLCGPNAPRLPQPGPEALEGETVSGETEDKHTAAPQEQPSAKATPAETTTAEQSAEKTTPAEEKPTRSANRSSGTEEAKPPAERDDENTVEKPPTETVTVSPAPAGERPEETPPPRSALH